VFASLSESERVETGIKDLNELTDGSLPRGFSFLLLGGPGTGKITFRVQYLWKGATKCGESEMYVIFDEPPYSISDHRQGYGWNLGEQGKLGKISFVNASPIKREAEVKRADATASSSCKTSLPCACTPILVLILCFFDISTHVHAFWSHITRLFRDEVNLAKSRA
jgi:KaiC/GvpD/RAD55 family RecA-like ATPase